MKIRVDDNKAYFTIGENLDQVEGNNLQSAVLNLLEDNPHVKEVFVEMINCNYINSSGIARLVELYNELKAKNIGLRLTDVTEPVLSIFKLTHLDKMFLLGE